MAILAKMITDTGIILNIDGDTKHVTKDHPSYEIIKEALRNGDDDKIEKLVDTSKIIREWKFITQDGEAHLKVENGVVMYRDEELNDCLARRILGMIRDDFDLSPLVNFLEKLSRNPSYRAVNGLYQFLENTDLPLTPDGCFVAYKMVRENYTDNRTGKFDNSVGAIVEMPRNKVDEDPENTCSHGLHVCSQKYLKHYDYGPRTIVVKVDPADVVAVPKDYKNSKMRVCRYEVISEITEELNDKSKVVDRKDHSFNTSVYKDEEATTDVTTELTDGMPGYEKTNFASWDQAAEVLCPDAKDPAMALRKKYSRGTVYAVKAGTFMPAKSDPRFTNEPVELWHRSGH